MKIPWFYNLIPPLDHGTTIVPLKRTVKRNLNIFQSWNIADSQNKEEKEKKSAYVDPADVKEENIHKHVITGRDFQHMLKYIG